jgi:hypothetical protein
MHMCVHIKPRHAGASLRGTHLSAWQQMAGTQSESLSHAVPSAREGVALVGALGDEAAGAPPEVSADGRAQLAHANAIEVNARTNVTCLQTRAATITRRP